MKRVVFGGANAWDSPFQVGSHAWARLFAANDWSVFYISDPVTPWHFLSGRGRASASARLAAWRHPIREGEIRAWVPFSLVAPHPTPVMRSAWALENWPGFAMPSPAAKAASLGFDRPDLLWLDSVRHASWARRLRPARTVLRVADWSAGFGSVPPAALELERRLVGEADLVIASAATLGERLAAWRGGRPLAVIRNGVEPAFWRDRQPEPPEFASIPSPRVVYVGAIDDWFDAGLVSRLASRYPGWSFVMVGAVRRALPAPLPNLHWLGARSRPMARACVQHSRVGIIPFVRNDLVDHVCPLKLYEYMASGLPVVATRWSELAAMSSPAALCSDDEEWSVSLRAAVERGGGAAETRYAEANSWGARWEQFRSSISPLQA